jgi:hypothetical protein
MRIGKGNRSTWSKSAPVPFFPPQIPHDLTLVRTQAAAVITRFMKFQIDFSNSVLCCISLRNLLPYFGMRTLIRLANVWKLSAYRIFRPKKLNPEALLCYYITRERTRQSNFQSSCFIIRKSPVIFSTRRPVSSLKSSVAFLSPSKQVLESVYGSTILLLHLSRFFSFLILYTVGRIPWAGDEPVERINAYRHLYLEWDSSPRSQRSSEQRQFMPQTARLLWSAKC